MKCPVCGNEAKARLYYCDRCAAHVHTLCREKHAGAHKKQQVGNGG